MTPLNEFQKQRIPQERLDLGQSSIEDLRIAISPFKLHTDLNSDNPLSRIYSVFEKLCLDMKKLHLYCQKTDPENLGVLSPVLNIPKSQFQILKSEISSLGKVRDDASEVTSSVEYIGQQYWKGVFERIVSYHFYECPFMENTVELERLSDEEKISLEIDSEHTISGKRKKNRSPEAQDSSWMDSMNTGLLTGRKNIARWIQSCSDLKEIQNLSDPEFVTLMNHGKRKLTEESVTSHALFKATDDNRTQTTLSSLATSETAVSRISAEELLKPVVTKTLTPEELRQPWHGCPGKVLIAPMVDWYIKLEMRRRGLKI